MFLGSSVEGKRIADAVALSLEHDVDCVPWPTAFPLAHNTIDSLLAVFPSVDFGAFVLSPDDKTIMREKGFDVARDNVLIEASLFMGSHGKSRTFLITPRDSSLHIPTDLLGLTLATYDGARAKSHEPAALYSVATQIRLAIESVLDSERKLDVRRFARAEAGAYWPLKGYFELTNYHQSSVALRSLRFEFEASAPQAPNINLTRGVYVPGFKVGQDGSKQDIYEETFILRPRQPSFAVWVPFDPAIGEAKLKELVTAEAAGIWEFQETWLDDTNETRRRALKL
jgi:hypothetical protein